MTVTKTSERQALTSDTSGAGGTRAFAFAGGFLFIFDLLYSFTILTPVYFRGAQSIGRFQIVTEPGLTIFQQFLWLALPFIAAPLFSGLVIATVMMRSDLPARRLRVLALLFALSAAVFAAGWSTYSSVADWLYL